MLWPFFITNKRIICFWEKKIDNFEDELELLWMLTIFSKSHFVVHTTIWLQWIGEGLFDATMYPFPCTNKFMTPTVISWSLHLKKVLLGLFMVGLISTLYYNIILLWIWNHNVGTQSIVILLRHSPLSWHSIMWMQTFFNLIFSLSILLKKATQECLRNKLDYSI